MGAYNSRDHSKFGFTLILKIILFSKNHIYKTYKYLLPSGISIIRDYQCTKKEYSIRKYQSIKTQSVIRSLVEGK